MDLLLQNKKAIVTGGTRGIGLAIIETLLAEGACVSFCARDQTKVDATVKRLANQGKVSGYAVDISDKNSLEPWFNKAVNALEGLDCLILNAGAMVAENSEIDWHKNFMVDLMGAFRIVELARPHLLKAAKKHDDASIIIISSISGMEAHGPSSYGPIKAALIHYAKGMSQSLGENNIRVNVISPGPVYFKEGYWHRVEQQNPEGFKETQAQTALKRFTKPEEIAAAVAFLSSPLSASTTGSNLVIDSGITVNVPF